MSDILIKYIKNKYKDYVNNFVSFYFYKNIINIHLIVKRVIKINPGADAEHFQEGAV